MVWCKTALESLRASVVCWRKKLAASCLFIMCRSGCVLLLFAFVIIWQYMPVAEDLVVGTVVDKHTENYRVDIGTAQPARLPALAFEGATKRNKPNLQVGALVYARVVSANKHMEAELACTSVHFKKEWVTGQSLFGELVGGYAFNCSLSLAKR